MGADGEETRRSSSLGKGKARSSEDQGEDAPVRNVGGLLSSIAQSARSSVTPSNLASLAASNGKAASSLPPSHQLSTQAQESRQGSSSTAATYSQSRLPTGQAAEATASVSRQSAEDAYRQFAQSGTVVSPSMHTSPRVLIGPYSSAEPLQHALHEQVREETSKWHDMNEAWGASNAAYTDKQAAPSSMHDPLYDSAWVCSYVNPSFSAGIVPDWRRGEHLDELMQEVDISGNAPHDHVSHAVPSDAFMDLLGREEQVETVPSASVGPNDMSEEQANLHRSLHTLQNSEERASEKIRPPDDDPVARTGVYAATPSEALQAIWDGPAEGERASAVVRDRHGNTDGRSIARKIREILKRGSYVDDVYGIPPQLEKEIVAAEEEETEENKDRRAKAIERLGALYRHLGAAPAHQSFSVDDFVRDW